MAIQAVSGERPRKRTRRRVKHPWLRHAALIALCVLAALFLSIVAFRFINPPFTTVMIAEKLKGYTFDKKALPAPGGE